MCENDNSNHCCSIIVKDNTTNHEAPFQKYAQICIPHGLYDPFGGSWGTFRVNWSSHAIRILSAVAGASKSKANGFSIPAARLRNENFLCGQKVSKARLSVSD